MNVDGRIVCCSCGGTAHDLVDEHRNKSLLSCAYCGTAEWVKGIFKKKPASEGFKFTEGRYSGMTINEVANVSGGMKYLKAKSLGDSNDAVAIRKHLAAPQAKSALPVSHSGRPAR